jgi:hypothetical protein
VEQADRQQQAWETQSSVAAMEVLVALFSLLGLVEAAAVPAVQVMVASEETNLVV